MKRFHRLFPCCLTLAALLPATAAHAAQPSSGALQTTGQATWTGGPYQLSVPNQLGCVLAFNPTCDAYNLTVDLTPGSRFVVAVESEIAGDDYDLYVYYPNGTEAGRSANAGGTESVVITHDNLHGSGAYKVRVLPFQVTAGSTYKGLAKATSAQTVEPEDPDVCLEAVPVAIGLNGLTDPGQTISLDVALLLDGVSLADADRIMQGAAASFAPLNIDLNVVSYTDVSFTGTEGTEMIQQAKDFYGGVRPAGSDVVYVLTSKDLTTDGSTGLAGLADCIGGVRFPQHAFAVGEANVTAPAAVGPFFLSLDADPEVVAHEIGHLLGVHHHYANCVEGNLTSAGAGDLSPCTLMFNFVELQSLNFGLLEGLVARGHAVQFAAP